MWRRGKLRPKAAAPNPNPPPVTIDPVKNKLVLTAQNIILWKWESGSDETKDSTVYKSLGCAGNCHVRLVEKAVVDGGHRLNCLCYLLDSADENDFVPSFRVTKSGSPYKSPCKLRFYFYLPELKECCPIIEPEGSDSQTFDNVLELLIMGGRTLPEAILMMMPEAWQNNDLMPAEKRRAAPAASTRLTCPLPRPRPSSSSGDVISRQMPSPA